MAGELEFDISLPGRPGYWRCLVKTQAGIKLVRTVAVKNTIGSGAFFAKLSTETAENLHAAMQ